MKKNIAVLGGGYSPEHEISLKSAERVFKWLVEVQRYNVYLIHINRDVWCEAESKVEVDRSDFSIMLDNRKIVFDKVVNVVHGNPGENGVLQSYFDLLNISYTGCSAFVTALTQNKFACKSYLSTYGIEMGDGILIRKFDENSPNYIGNRLGFPFFIKPNSGGSSCNVTKVKSEQEISAALDRGFSEEHELLAEQFLNGREFTIGVYKLGQTITTLPITEVISENDFFDYEAKYQGRSSEITGISLPKEINENIVSRAKKIYQILDCRGVVRIDFILVQDIPYFLEVNTIPGMSEASIIPQQLTFAGWKISEFLSQMVEQS